MLRLHLSDKGTNVLFCPVCNRELVPAYRSDEGLEVGFWSDFDPIAAGAREGLLVCGNFECDYEEPVRFTAERADAVCVSREQIYWQFEEENDWNMPESVAREILESLREVYAQTGRAKLRSAIEWYEQLIEDRGEHIAAWIKEAGRQYPVCFRSENGEYTGIITESEGDSIRLETPDGESLTFLKADITWERIEYPTHRHREPGETRLSHFVRVIGIGYMVVQGFHIHEREAAGQDYLWGWTTDPAAGEALHMKKTGETYAGLFRRDEVERYYLRREMARIGGIWLKDHGRTMDDELASVETDNPAVAEQLGLEPVYNRVEAEFGWKEGDKIEHYSGYVPASLIEETSWYEEPSEAPEPEEDLLIDL